MAKRWYVVHVYSGFEKKIAQQIKEQAAQKGLADQFEEVLVPSENVVEVRRGQKFNAELMEARRQAELGWKPQFGYRDQRLELTLQDASGRALTGFAVEAEIERPSTDREDKHLTFIEKQPGAYRAEGRLSPGQWDAEVTIKDVSGRTMRRIYRFVVKKEG